MHISNVPVIAFEKLSGMASPALHQFVITVSGLVFLWVLIVWSIQRHYRQYVLPAAEARFRLVTWWMGFSVVLFVCATALTMGGPNDVVFGLPTGLRIALMIPWITIALALLSVVLYAGVFRESSVTRLGRAGYAIVMLAGVGFSWFVLYWRIAG